MVKAIFITIIISFLLISGCQSQNKISQNNTSYEENISQYDSQNNITTSVTVITQNSYEFKKNKNEDYSLNNNDSKINQRLNKEIKTFHYQLQGVKYSAIENMNVDLVITDIDDANFSNLELQKLEKEKIMLSYLSIGEAEDYRDYWQEDWGVGNPDFIDKENPQWKGNYKVKYWKKDWQRIILKRVEEIAKKGYDGVYLDVIDAYEFYAYMSSINTREEMINFVDKIKSKGQEINPDFIVVVQNAPELYEDSNYRNIIKGFGIEDTFYNDNAKIDPDEITEKLRYLDEAKKDNKTVMLIDYPTSEDRVCDFYKRCSNHGFACMVSNRDLNLNKKVECKNE